MPKPHTFPYLFDEEKNISVTNFRKWGYLKQNSRKTGIITWSRNGIETSSLSVEVLMNESSSSLSLKYKCNDKSYNYLIPLVWLPSNLGKGFIWYFLCPFTKKRCLKLHLINERFMHRSVLPSGMYASQTHSKKWRLMEKVYGCYFDVERNYEQLYSKHFKTHYKGKPTKRYLKLKERIDRAEGFSSNEIENLLSN